MGILDRLKKKPKPTPEPPKAPPPVAPFDLGNLIGTILCASCRTDLWILRILKHHGGKVQSTEMKPASEGIPHYKSGLSCPACGKGFFHVAGKGNLQFLVRSHKTGQEILL